MCYINSSSVLWHCWLCGRKSIRPVKKWRWALVSLDGVVPSQMVDVSASVNLSVHHKVQKFSSGTGSPRWSEKKSRKTVAVDKTAVERMTTVKPQRSWYIQVPHRRASLGLRLGMLARRPQHLGPPHGLLQLHQTLLVLVAFQQHASHLGASEPLPLSRRHVVLTSAMI